MRLTTTTSKRSCQVKIHIISPRGEPSKYIYILGITTTTSAWINLHNPDLISCTDLECDQTFSHVDSTLANTFFLPQISVDVTESENPCLYIKEGGEVYDSTCNDQYFVCELDCGTLAPTNGNWGTWGSYGSCNGTCGEAYMHRTRVCDSPKPSDGGLYCVGSDTEATLCSLDPCPGISAVNE